MRRGFLHTSSSRHSVLSDDSTKLQQAVKKGGKFCIQDFTTQRLLGSGNFSQVYLVSENGTDNDFALKIFNKNTVAKLNKVKDVCMERHCLLKLNSPGHPNVLKMIDTFKDNANVYIIYELAEEGELWDYVKDGGCTYEPIARYYIGQLLNAVEYVHSKNIVHRDLKAENLVIDHTGVLKLIDFGSALDLDNSQLKEASTSSSEILDSSRYADALPDLEKNQKDSSTLHRNAGRMLYEHYVGTSNFMPPESIHNIDSGLRRDFWGLGCTIYQILAGAPPFQASTEFYIYNKILNFELEFPPGFPPLAEDLVRQLLKVDPFERLGAAGGIEAIKAHAYFEGVDFATLHLSCRPVSSLTDLCIKRIAHRFWYFFNSVKEKVQEEKGQAIDDASTKRHASSLSDSYDSEEEAASEPQRDTLKSDNLPEAFTESDLPHNFSRSQVLSNTPIEATDETRHRSYLESHRSAFEKDAYYRVFSKHWLETHIPQLSTKTQEKLQRFPYEIEQFILQDACENKYAEQWLLQQRQKPKQKQ